jgi:hypothetical protein
MVPTKTKKFENCGCTTRMASVIGFSYNTSRTSETLVGAAVRQPNQNQRDNNNHASPHCTTNHDVDTKPADYCHERRNESQSRVGKFSCRRCQPAAAMERIDRSIRNPRKLFLIGSQQTRTPACCWLGLDSWSHADHRAAITQQLFFFLLRFIQISKEQDQVEISMAVARLVELTKDILEGTFASRDETGFISVWPFLLFLILLGRSSTPQDQ